MYMQYFFFSCEGGWALRGRVSSRLRTSDRSRCLVVEAVAKAGEAGGGGCSGCGSTESGAVVGPKNRKNCGSGDRGGRDGCRKRQRRGGGGRPRSRRAFLQRGAAGEMAYSSSWCVLWVFSQGGKV
ncbi:hypothetical protein CRG98_026264 [Punica granatum]|uniref:Uncharacterized protein n=1 Tax=Punica granatum TaxID=22663 RepID=A0A2I0JAQ1_PUNGR|nr:hypothetical protein CRG98_026264 [Punica granatum]